jgi:hypothetical protein
VEALVFVECFLGGEREGERDDDGDACRFRRCRLERDLERERELSESEEESLERRFLEWCPILNK